MYDARVKIFEDILLNSPIDIKKLRKECQLGCPDSNGLRSKIWKVLLNYLPLDHSQWNKFLTRSRREYSNLATEFVVSSTNNESNCDDVCCAFALILNGCSPLVVTLTVIGGSISTTMKCSCKSTKIVVDFILNSIFFGGQLRTHFTRFIHRL
uniref:TBC1 domain family member 13 n=1 Tax=Schistocephalus solidus TaxID=70667 RepID=A0A0V0JAV9_SCHSO